MNIYLLRFNDMSFREMIPGAEPEVAGQSEGRESRGNPIQQIHNFYGTPDRGGKAGKGRYYPTTLVGQHPNFNTTTSG